MAERCDLLIIGAGAAGMPAALFGSGDGRNVVLIDAADRIGGTFHLSSGQMSAAGTRVQAANGIVDSPQAHYDDIMRISRGTANPGIVKLATEHAADTLHWLLDNGLELLPDHPIIHYGHEPYSVPRTYWGPEEGRSVLAVLAPLIDAAVAEGRIDLRLETRLIALERTNGTGLRAVLDCAGTPSVIDADAIVLATGGYSANAELFPSLSSGQPLHGGGSPGSQGDGLLAAAAVGGTIINREAFLPTFAAVEDASAHGGMTFATQTYPQFRQPWEVYVDGAGDRFVREDDPSVDRRERALLALPNLQFWAIFDDRIRREAPPFFTLDAWEDVAPRFNREPAYRRADDVPTLAAAMAVDPAKLAHTLADYNAAIADGGPDPMGREHRPLPIIEPPFYAVRHFGWSIVGFAGLGVDDELRVIDASGDPIPGLFAAGEILGLAATSGNAFAGGMSVTPAMTFGRLLGQRLRAVQ